MLCLYQASKLSGSVFVYQMYRICLFLRFWYLILVLFQQCVLIVFKFLNFHFHNKFVDEELLRGVMHEPGWTTLQCWFLVRRVLQCFYVFNKVLECSFRLFHNNNWRFSSIAFMKYIYNEFPSPKEYQVGGFLWVLWFPALIKLTAGL